MGVFDETRGAQNPKAPGTWRFTRENGPDYVELDSEGNVTATGDVAVTGDVVVAGTITADGGTVPTSLYVAKPSDTARTADATPDPDPHLQLTDVPAGTWWLEAFLEMSGATTGDFALLF